MKVGGDNNHYSYIADNYNHMTFLCKGKCRRYKQFFICFYKGASLRPVSYTHLTLPTTSRV